jgi:hypothetical protein
MLQTVQGVLNPDGNILLLEKVITSHPVRVLVTVLDDEPNLAVMSEQSLAQDWLNDAEEEAWLHLQAVQ